MFDHGCVIEWCRGQRQTCKGAFALNVKSVLSENLGGILGGTQY